MAPILWIVFAVIVLFGVIAAFILYTQKGKHEPDYRTFFNLGLVFFIIGLGSQNSAMWIIGLVFFIVGLTNKDKWKKQKKWKQLSDKERRIKFILIGVLTLLVILGAVVVLSKRGV
ncbi:MAG: hypothetical protein QF632_05745 [Candidatus Woesearchaeota archaeon]|jgi:O-antigen ligase|nr:hypothetical protein [Candidatus Woesearchaeota archaeon]MDP7324235.1 hypothetical protein [Candidatus Woesearchaeota archaeon]MDP7457560.1 hypothetical protein [Candidatus Woesearchaeota archaeon]